MCKGKIGTGVTRRHAPEKIMAAAMKLLDLSMHDIVSRNKMGPAPRSREAVSGAIHELSLPQPSFPWLATMMGDRHHSTVMYQVKRFNRDWPLYIRQRWLDAVLKQADDDG